MTTLAHWGEHLPFTALLPLSSVIGHGGNRLTNVSQHPSSNRPPLVPDKIVLMGGGCLQEKSRT